MFHPPCFAYGIANISPINFDQYNASPQGRKLSETFDLYSNFNEDVNQLPLNCFSLQGKIVNNLAYVNISQTFTCKPGHGMSNTIYEILLDENASLCNFEAKVGNREVHSKIEKVTQKKNNSSPNIGREEVVNSPRLISVSLGPIHGGDDLEVKITYITRLNVTDGEVQFYLPSTFGIEGEEDIIFEVFELELEMSSNIVEVISPSHNSIFEGDESDKKKGKCSVFFDLKKGFTDFVLNIQLEDNIPLAYVQVDETGKKAAVINIPSKIIQKSIHSTPIELIFVIDCSGSVDDKIQWVKSALNAMVDAVPKGAVLNFIAFGQSPSSLFAESVDKTDENIALIKKFIKKLKGNLGQTNALGGINCALALPKKSGFARQIYIFTDGEVKNISECISTVKKNVNEAQFSTFGIVGSDQRQHFIQGIARAGKGFSLTVNEYDGSEFTEKALDQMDKTLRKAIIDVSVDWNSSQVEDAPTKHSDIYLGDDVHLYAFLKDDSELKQVAIKGNTGGQEFNYVVPIPNPTEGNILHKHVATSIIQNLSNQDFDTEKIYSLSEKYWINSPVAAITPFDDKNEFTYQLEECYVFEKEPPLPVKQFSTGFWTSSSIKSETVLDKLLESGEYTLEQLLDEEDFFSECQTSNDLVLEFLTKKHVCKKLLKYLAQTPKDDKVQMGYTYKCSEIFSLPNIWSEAKETILSKSCISQVINPFLEHTNGDLPETTLLRLCRALTTILNLQADKLAEILVSYQSPLLNSFVKYLRSHPFLDFMILLSKVEDANLHKWLLSGNIIEHCVQLLKSDEVTVKESVSNLLVVLLNGSRLNPECSQIIEEQLKHIISFVFSPKTNADTLMSCLKIITAFITSQKSDKYLHSALELVNQSLPQIKEILNETGVTRNCSFGAITVCGQRIIAVIDFLNALVLAKHSDITKAIVESMIINDCLNAFFRSPLNNFLHTSVVRLIDTIMSNSDDQHKAEILKKSDILNLIITGILKSAEKAESGHNCGLYAYGGHLLQLAQIITRQKSSSLIVTILEGNKNWLEFETGELLDIQHQSLATGIFLPSKPNIKFNM